MRSTTIEMILAAIGAAGMVFGIILVLLARRGRRIDDHPICRKCGYDLTGKPESSTRCAECGADLSRRRAVRMGNRTPSRRLFWGGMSLTTVSLLLLAAFTWLQRTQVDLMPYKPVWLLRAEASSLVAAKRTPAVAELTRRLIATELTDGQVQAIVSDALSLQPDLNFPWAEWGGLTNQLLMAGKIGEADWTRFIRQAVRLRLITRPRVRAGDPMPVELHLDAERLPRREVARPPGVMVGLGPLPPPAIEFQWADVSISNLKAATIPSHQSRYPAMISPMSLVGVLFNESQTAGLAPGVHPLTGRVTIHVLEQKAKKRIASFDLDVRSTVTILPADTDPKSFFVSDPALKEGIEQAIWVGLIGPARGSVTDMMYTLQLSMSDPPVGLYHQAYLRAADGREFSFGSIGFYSRDNGGSNRSSRAELGEAVTVDVILRPDYELLKQSARGDAIWGEEIVFHDVQIMRRSPIERGGRAPAARERGGPGTTQPARRGR